jgi:hypothetical protein
VLLHIFKFPYRFIINLYGCSDKDSNEEEFNDIIQGSVSLAALRNDTLVQALYLFMLKPDLNIFKNNE